LEHIMAFLELRGLEKRYGDLVAVDRFDLQVERGEFVALLGPSGCGKTTTLQMIAGFVEPTAGSVALDGSDITCLKPERRGLGIVFQSYALFPHMTVADNVGFGLEMKKIGRADRERRVSEALALVHLESLMARYPRELSGGQRQRVAIARALVIKPPVLLLDEPLSNLDAKLREEMHIELRALQRQVNITTILVTHDQAEAMTLADRVVVMNRGRVEQAGVPYELYERPNGAFVSAFLGKTNRIAGRVVESASARTFQMGETILASGCSSPLGDGALYVRPERVRFASDSAGLLSGEVTSRLFLGHLWLFQVRTPAGTMILTQPNTGLPLQREGDRVELTWAPEDGRILPGGAEIAT
jgi:putative spermidine/putrescine transport system ATP-binding protein